MILGDWQPEISNSKPKALDQEPSTLNHPSALQGDRCVIQNKVWRTKSFRKIHIELATFFNKKGEVSLSLPLSLSLFLSLFLSLSPSPSLSICLEDHLLQQEGRGLLPGEEGTPQKG